MPVLPRAEGVSGGTGGMRVVVSNSAVSGTDGRGVWGNLLVVGVPGMASSASRSKSMSTVECRRDLERLKVGEGGPGDIDLDLEEL